MFTSVKKKLLRTALLYLFITMFCVLFGAVYEIFSHGVYSYFMIYAFAFPLILGVLPFLALALSGKLQAPALPARSLYHFGVATLMVGSFVNGILEIYGTTNSLTLIYWIAGATLAAAGVLAYVFGRRLPQSANGENRIMHHTGSQEG